MTILDKESRILKPFT